jgi:ADP-dependent NAD(P)H-hydrate dehydratase / NAD(P)H-hydrate epimerase
MLPVLSAAEMRAADRRTIEGVGLPGAVLMENAGAAVAGALCARWPAARRVVVLAGKGNNGGDGFVVARRLLERDPLVLLIGARGEVKGDAALHLQAFERCGGRVVEVADGRAWGRAKGRLAEADVVVDALLGTGLKDAPSGLVADAIGQLAFVHAQKDVPVVAVDIPSGLSSDSGRVEWNVASATLTVTFAAPKWGHVVPPACNLVGELLVADIGISRQALLESGTRLYLVEDADVRPAFPARAPGAHKGSFGHVLVVAGSRGKTGAASLAGLAALRAGAGLVTVATPGSLLGLVAAARPELMSEPLAESDGALAREALERILVLAKDKDAVVLGPGLGQAETTRELVRELVRRCARPLVLDADGLNAVAGGALSALKRRAPTLLTPHPGEAGRLLGASAAEVQARRVESARELAAKSGATVVLKGQRTVTARPDGEAWLNSTGNPGLATGGTGDVLSGILGALLARGLDARLAGAAGAYVHGRAGDLAARGRGFESLVAGDVIDALGEAIVSLAAPAPGRSDS